MTAGIDKASTAPGHRQPSPRRVFALLMVLSMTVAPGRAVADPNAPWPWPVPVDPPQITATFMEARTGGYHTGLDIRTMGRTGLPVRTPLAGSVQRIRVSPAGYGKALYLDVGGGRTLVFAHLMAFADPIQALVRARQAESREYEQQIYLEPGELTFEAGDVVALSGDTGIGAPHLHFEVREGDVPVNPIDFFDVPDTEAPVITGIRVVPVLDVVGWERREAILPTEVSHADTVDVVGTVGIQVAVEERTGLNRFGLLPRRVSLELGDGTGFTVDFARIAFDERWQRGLVAEWEDGTRWINLFRRPQASHLDDGGWDGRLAVDGTVGIVVRVEDHRGRTAAAQVTLVGPRDGRRQGHRQLTSTGPDSRDDVGFQAAHSGVIVWSRSGSPGVSFRSERSGVSFESGSGWVPPAGADDAMPPATLGFPAYSIDVVKSGTIELGGRVWPVVKSDNRGDGPAVGSVEFVDGTVRVVDPTPDDFSTDTILWIRPADVDAPPRHDGVGPAFEVVSPAVAFRRGVEVSVDVPGPPSEYTLNARSRKGRWSPESGVGPDPDHPQAIRTRLVDTGVYRVVRDVTPPALGPWRVHGDPVRDDVTLIAREDVRHGVTLPRWPALRLDVADAIAGIDPEDVRVLVDDLPYPARPELEDDHVWIEWDVDPGAGTHVVRVEVADRLGNTATSRITVRLVD